MLYQHSTPDHKKASLVMYASATPTNREWGWYDRVIAISPLFFSQLQFCWHSQRYRHHSPYDYTFPGTNRSLPWSVWLSAYQMADWQIWSTHCNWPNLRPTHVWRPVISIVLAAQPFPEFAKCSGIAFVGQSLRWIWCFFTQTYYLVSTTPRSSVISFSYISTTPTPYEVSHANHCIVIFWRTAQETLWRRQSRYENLDGQKSLERTAKYINSRRTVTKLCSLDESWTTDPILVFK